MSYNTYVSGELEIREDVNREKFLEEFKKMKEEKDWNFIYINDNGDNDSTLGFGEEVGTMGDEYLEECAKFIAPYVCDGEIACDGEESDDFWKICFDGKGNYVIKSATLIFDSLFDEFMEENKEKLPEELKERLLEWKGAMEV